MNMIQPQQRRQHFAQILTVVILYFGCASLGIAEVIEIPLAAQGGELADSIDKPTKGATKQAVITEFGTPLAQTPAVGTPPISRWEYPDYFVFFENNHVIHAVLKHKPSK